METGISSKEESSPSSAVRNYGHIPQLITSVHPLNEALSFPAQKTSRLSHGFFNFVEHPFPGHTSTSEVELVTLTSGKMKEPLSCSDSSLGDCSTSSEHSYHACIAQSLHDVDVRSLVRKSSQDTSELMGPSHSILGESSIFQRLGFSHLGKFQLMEAGPSKEEKSITPSSGHGDGLKNEGLIPQLITPVPSLNKAASHLAQTTSYLSCYFSKFFEHPVREHAITNELELSTLTSEKTKESLSSSYFSLRNCSTPSEHSSHIGAAKSFQKMEVGSSLRKSFQDTSEPMVSSQCVQRGSSNFRRYKDIGFTTGVADHPMPELASTSELELATLTSEKLKESFSKIPCFSLGNHSTSFKPLSHISVAQPFHDAEVRSSLRKVFRDTSEPMVSSQSFQRGSSNFQRPENYPWISNDIGWLQQVLGMPPVEDGTKRFVELLNSIRNGEHKLPDSMVYLLVPGLVSNYGSLYFINTKTYFSKMGLASHITKIHSEASVEKNAKAIKDYVEEIYWGSRKPVLLIGHSKGGVDAAAALSTYWSDLKDSLTGLALMQSPYGGSPIASDILREQQLGDVNLRRFVEFLICKVIKADMQAVEDLTYERRKEYLKKYLLPRELPVISFHAEAGIGPGVFSSFCRVAYAKIPIIANLSASQSAKVPVVMPPAAALAACAKLFPVRYGEMIDGLVAQRDAEVPGPLVVRPDLKLDHCWMVY